jgi:hypothetical protein
MEVVVLWDEKPGEEFGRSNDGDTLGFMDILYTED